MTPSLTGCILVTDEDTTHTLERIVSSNDITVTPIDSTTWIDIPATVTLAAGSWHFQVSVASSSHFRNAPVDLAAPVPAYAIERALSASFGEPVEIVRAKRTI